MMIIIREERGGRKADKRTDRSTDRHTNMPGGYEEDGGRDIEHTSAMLKFDTKTHRQRLQIMKAFRRAMDRLVDDLIMSRRGSILFKLCSICSEILRRIYDVVRR